MRAAIYHQRGTIPRLNYMAEGLRKKGWDVDVFDPESPEFEVCDLAVVSGALERYESKNCDIFFHYRVRRVPVFVAEFGRLVDTTGGCRHWLLYLNRVPMVAKPTREMTHDRRLALGLECNFKPRGEAVLVVGQNRENDLALREYVTPWLKEHTGRQIIYRPRKEIGSFIGLDDGVDEVSVGRTAQEDLDRAWCVVTSWSNMGCEALMRGIPVVCNHRAAYAHLGYDDPAVIDSLQTPRQEDVERYLMCYSYTIWANEELSEGVEFMLENQR